MRFELTIPPLHSDADSAVLVVEAPNWLAALQKALDQMGEAQIPRGKAVCEVREDGSIRVRNAADGRRFFIVPRPDHTPETPSAKPPPGRQVPFGTMTYLQAELERVPGGVRARNPKKAVTRDPNTGAHPCLVLDRAAIQRRIDDYQRGVEAARQAAPTAPPARVQNAGSAVRKVQFVHVVDAPAGGHDTLSSLQVDLDMLRRAGDPARMVAPGERRAPAGFEWLQEPLEAALASARSLPELADRALRVLLAALPSRAALFLRCGARTPDPARLIAAIGAAASPDRILPPAEPDSPLAVAACGVSMALEASAGDGWSTRCLRPLLDCTPENALVAAITGGGRTLGLLILTHSLGAPRYTPGELAVATYIAGRLHPVLEYWVGAESRTRSK